MSEPGANSLPPGHPNSHITPGGEADAPVLLRSGSSSFQPGNVVAPPPHLDEEDDEPGMASVEPGGFRTVQTNPGRFQMPAHLEQHAEPGAGVAPVQQPRSGDVLDGDVRSDVRSGDVLEAHELESSEYSDSSSEEDENEAKEAEFDVGLATINEEVRYVVEDLVSDVVAEFRQSMAVLPPHEQEHVPSPPMPPQHESAPPSPPPPPPSDSPSLELSSPSSSDTEEQVPGDIEAPARPPVDDYAGLAESSRQNIASIVDYHLDSLEHPHELSQEETQHLHHLVANAVQDIVIIAQHSVASQQQEVRPTMEALQTYILEQVTNVVTRSQDALSTVVGPTADSEQQQQSDVLFNQHVIGNILATVHYTLDDLLARQAPPSLDDVNNLNAAAAASVEQVEHEASRSRSSSTDSTASVSEEIAGLLVDLVMRVQEQHDAEVEQERVEQEQRVEQERVEQERVEQERLEQERLEQERLEQERLEQERLEQERRTREAEEAASRAAHVARLAEEEAAATSSDSESDTETRTAAINRAALLRRAAALREQHAAAEREKLAGYTSEVSRRAQEVNSRAAAIITEEREKAQLEEIRALEFSERVRRRVEREERSRQELAFLLHMSERMGEDAKKAEEERALRNELKRQERAYNLQAVRLLRQKEMSAIQAEVGVRAQEQREAMPEADRVARALELAQSIRAGVELKRALEGGRSLSAAREEFEAAQEKERRERERATNMLKDAQRELSMLEDSDTESESELERQLGRPLTTSERQQKMTRRTARAKARATARRRIAMLQEEQFKRQAARAQKDALARQKEIQARKVAERLRAQREAQARKEREKAEYEAGLQREAERQVGLVLEDIIFKLEEPERNARDVQQTMDDLLERVEEQVRLDEVTEVFESSIMLPIEREENTIIAGMVFDDMVADVERMATVEVVMAGILHEVEMDAAVHSLIGELIVEAATEEYREAQDEAEVQNVMVELVSRVHMRENSKHIKNVMSRFSEMIERRRRAQRFAMARLRPLLAAARQRIHDRHVAEERAAEERLRAGQVLAALMNKKELERAKRQIKKMKENQAIERQRARQQVRLELQREVALEQRRREEELQRKLEALPKDEEQVHEAMNMMLSVIEHQAVLEEQERRAAEAERRRREQEAYEREMQRRREMKEEEERMAREREDQAKELAARAEREAALQAALYGQDEEAAKAPRDSDDEEEQDDEASEVSSIASSVDLELERVADDDDDDDDFRSDFDEEEDDEEMIGMAPPPKSKRDLTPEERQERKQRYLAAKARRAELQAELEALQKRAEKHHHILSKQTALDEVMQAAKTGEASVGELHKATSRVDKQAKEFNFYDPHTAFARAELPSIPDGPALDEVSLTLKRGSSSTYVAPPKLVGGAKQSWKDSARGVRLVQPDRQDEESAGFCVIM